MEFFHRKKNIPFMNYGKLTTSISLITFLISIFFLIYNGLNLSIEFTGGTVMDISFKQAVDVDTIRHKIKELNISDAVIQNLGTHNEILIRLPNKHQQNKASISDTVFNSVYKINNTAKLNNIEFIGPQVGQDLINNGLFAILFVCIGILIYLAVRFEWRFAIAAIIANMHDVVIILGFFAAFKWEFSLTVLAAILAVLGYSVNESVVVFDRIRENFRTKTELSNKEIIDDAINATISRTIITHGCTEMMVVSMLIFGGDSLHNFALALTIGILFGIYSSVLVASPIVMWLGVSKENMIKLKKPKEELVV